MAGRVQIAALGELSDSLTLNPSFSFFTKRYSKHVNYACENHKITFPEKVYTDTLLDAPIPQKYGDILQEVTLSFTVEPENVAKLGSNLYPIDIFGISLIEYVELYVGDQKIDRVTSDDIFIEREMNIPESYRSSIDTLHGKHFQGSSDGEFLQEFYDGQYNTQGIDPFNTNEYRIQIPFYFHKRPAHGFPLCAVNDQELLLRIKLRPAIDVIFATQEKFGGVTLWDPATNNNLVGQLELRDFKVNLDIVHLNTTERCMLRSKPLEILFEQRQRNEFMIEPQSKTGTFNLDLKNCVKELFFIAKKYGKWTDGDISILEKLHQLDQYTEAQKERLTLLKLIPVWGGIVTTALDSLVGQLDGDVRTAAIDAMLQAIYWGETTPFVGYLEALKDPAIDLVVQTNYINALKGYIAGIPSQVISHQINATSNLDALINATVTGRVDIIDNNLLTIPNFWGEEQVGILQLLKSPYLPEGQEELLIFGLRAYLTTASYYLSGLSELKPGATDQVATVTKLIEFLDNTKTEFDIIKLGLKAVLDSIPGKSEYLRARIVGALLKLGATLWGQTQRTQLESLLINPGNDTTIINTQAATITGLKAYLDGVYNQLSGVKTFVDAELTALAGETIESTRVGIVVGLLAIPDFWTATEEGYLETLKTYDTNTETTLILALRVYTNAKVTGVRYLNEGILDVISNFPGTTLEERIASVEVLRQTPIWGDDIIKLVLDYDNNVPTYTPTLSGYLTGILGAIPTLKYRLNALKGGINGVLDTLPTTAQDRDPIMLGIATSYAWSDEAFFFINALRTPSANDATYIAALKQKGIEEGVPNMTGYTQFDQNNVIDGIISLNLWGEKYYDLNDLRQIAPGFIGEQNVITALVAYLTQLGGQQSVINDLNNIPSITDTTQRAIAVAPLEALEGIWGETQLLLLQQLYIVGSEDHGAIVDGLVSYLNILAATIYNPTALPPTGLLPALQTPGTTSADLQDSDFKIAAWGGYFYYLLEDLKSTSPSDEAGIITKLTTYVNNTSLSETRNTNLKFLISQLTVAYPESIFNKWVRAKKNVPLMYSKQKTTTLDCDGTQILDKTTGSNMFLSASLPNLYHKRSPNFRNINMYSFALYPGELRPSGHLNFSTIKDARVTMELEYDGAHGTFDFDDNYITVFGIEPIYFPKQVIIIAKSYNMMIIRNGKAQIIY